MTVDMAETPIFEQMIREGLGVDFWAPIDIYRHECYSNRAEN